MLLGTGLADFFSRNEDGNLQPSFGSSMESDAGTGLGAALSAVSKRIERLEPALAAHMDDIGGKQLLSVASYEAELFWRQLDQRSLQSDG